MSVTRTIEFLPRFFQTEQNNKFLSATMDQMVSEPNLVRLNGYIGRKNAVNFKSTDNYILESTKDRTTYQLEPSVIARAANGDVNFVGGYQDLVSKLGFLGVNTTDHSRLFKNEYYSYKGLVDFDKFVNFSQYYWLPDGPDSVNVFGTEAPIEATFEITTVPSGIGATVNGKGRLLNPTLVLARGGRYEFTSTTLNNIWIQTEPGTSGFKTQQANISTREVLGVSDNGTNSVVFNVPQVTAQDQFLIMPRVSDIDLASRRSYADIQGKTFEEFALAYPDGIDGQRNLVGKLIVFLNPANFDDEIDWTDGVNVVDPALRYGIWRFPNDSDPTAVINLEYVRDVAVNEKVFVREGRESGNREYFKNTNNRFQLIPVITVVQDVLYYQDGSNPDIIGEIHLVDPIEVVNIDVESDILGKLEYTSPNGVVFTNGLKVRFDGNVTPSEYADQTFYVEGVGTGIQLVDARNLITPESFTTNQSIGFDIGGFDSTNYDEVLNAPTEPIYITIKRNSIDLNPWTRNNRWFHEDVIKATAQYNNFIPVIDQQSRASRPIIEFDSNLALFNFGRIGKKAVDLYDTSFVDAFGRTIGDSPGVETLYVEGNTSAVVDGVTLSPGMRVIFAADEESTVKNKIYVVNFIDPDASAGTDPIIHLTLAEDGDVDINDNIVVTNGNTNKGKSFWFNGSEWQESQQLTDINAEPVFDVFDRNGRSLADPIAYPGSTFAGTKILSYRRGNGRIDPILGFSLSYRNFASVGDIVFDNNYSVDTFTYNDTVSSTVTKKVDTGTIGLITGRETLERENIWSTIVEESKQYQQFSFVSDGGTDFKVGISAPMAANIPNTKLYINSRIVPRSSFQYVLLPDGYYIRINEGVPSAGDRVDIYIFSADTSSTGFYQIPVNLDNNSINRNFDSITLGQMRNHVQACYENSVDASGVFPGASNIRDINVKDNPGRILQHSAPLTYAMLFMNNELASFERSIDLARREYTRFKNKFLELAFNGSGFDPSDTVAAVDAILQDLNSFKTQDMPWFRSDMVPYGDDKSEIVYTITNTVVPNYEISRVYVDTTPSERAVLVYLNGVQLIRGRDYTFDPTGPNLLLSDTLARDFGDELRIVDYNSTDGCYIPETPTKLGMYPQYTPEIVLDTTFREPKRVIVGHDGSRTIAFDDFRDDLLIELEKRIYNNIKVRYDNARLDINSLIPGKFRDTDFTRTEFNELLATFFLRWVGTNRVEYTDNTFYDNNDGFTWCYSKFVDKLDGERLPGAWRGIYRYYFDCEDPSQRPWEMLGFFERPEWWEQSYGPAPYTSGNMVLWDDLAAGRVLLGERAGINPLYVRPGLQQIIPVNEYGELLSPHEFIVKQYEARNTVGSFVAGDLGPAEAAWARTSDYAFAIQYAIALSAPAKFFGLQANTHNYVRDNQLSQYFYEATGNRLQQSDIMVHGEIYDDVINRTTGYINWIADYIRSLGLDAKSELTRLVNQFTVQLSYKLAGYSDKRLLKAFAEQASPTSTNESILIPDGDFEIALNKSVPVKRLVYSAVLVTRTNNGWSVEGYDLENPVFTIIPSDITGAKKQVSESDINVTVYESGRPFTIEIPYGTEFSSRQQVADFLTSYERYLKSQGFVFDTVSKELGQLQDWVLSTREFLTWSQQGWSEGNVLVLTPVANQLVVTNENFIVDTLNDATSRGRLLDLNFKMLNPQDFKVFRGPQSTTVTIGAQSVGLARLTAVQYEHVIVFNNSTVFNDVIYQPELGNRQSRIKIVGKKTGSWDGSLTAPGYVLNQGAVENWQPGRDYKKADLVRYKGQFYAASKDLVAADVFNYGDWIISDYEDVDRGLLPNFANRAGAIERYYGVDDVNLEQDQDALSKGLIGFRTRKYLEDIGLDDSSQIKFYQGYIREKGTRRSLESLTRAQIDRLNSDIRFFEDWAVRVGEYGALSSTQSVEVTLKESQFSGNPSFFTFLDADDTRPLDRIGIKLTDLHRRPENYQRKLFLGSRANERALETEFNTAGPVRIDDVDLTLFDIDQYQTLSANINEIGVGTRLWVAKDDQQLWNVFRANRTDFRITSVSNLSDGLILFNVLGTHQLNIGDYIVVKNTTDIFDGVYRVAFVPSIQGFVVEYPSDLSGFEVLRDLTGYVLKFESLKVEYSSDIWDLQSDELWQIGDRVWVTRNNAEGEWAVYEKTEPWVETGSLRANSDTVSPGTGSSFAKNNLSTEFISGNPGDENGGTVQVFDLNGGEFLAGQKIEGPVGSVKFGYSVAQGEGNIIVVGDPEFNGRGKVYIYERTAPPDFSLTPIELTGDLVLGEQFGYSVTMSDDDLWIYVSSPGTNKVWAYKRDITSLTLAYDLIDTIQPGDVSLGDRFGHVVHCSTDGAQITVAAPMQNSNGDKSGSVYIYDRLVEAQLTDGGNNYTITRPFQSSKPTVVLGSTTLTTSEYNVTGPSSIELTLSYLVPNNQIIRIGADEFNLIQKITGSDSDAFDEFGYAVDICPNDCSVYVGAPGDEERGSVYRFLNQGRIYGTITGTALNPSVNPGDSIRIDDFEVVFTGSTLADVVDDINDAGLVGITARDTGGKLQINSDSETRFIRLRILPGVGSAISDLGLEVFKETQKVSAPRYEPQARFGSSISVSKEADRIAIGSPDRNTVTRTTFDGGDTYFDDRSTTVRSVMLRTGMTTIYQMLRNRSGTINKPDRLGLAQILVPAALTPGDRFGAASLYLQDTLFVGSPGVWENPVTWQANTNYQAGDVVEFDDNAYLVLNNYTSGGSFDLEGAEFGNLLLSDRGTITVYEDPTTQAGWAVSRTQPELVKIEAINSAYAYNKVTSQKLLTFDFIDPAKGRILGQVSQEIDYKTSLDPAYYSNGQGTTVVPELAWGKDQVGKVWWDLSKVRWIEYEQGDFAYRSANWGRTFPGSEIKVYEWVESTVTPDAYADLGIEGTPRNGGRTPYTAINTYDPVTGIFVTKYYYWVEGVSKIGIAGRALSLNNIVDLIRNPAASGVPYLTFLDRDSVGVWNANDVLINGDVILHIDYDILTNENLIHTEYQLIQEGNADTDIPMTIINKIVDSLCGSDVYGNPVPATNLSEAERYGISIRPRQSIFKDQKAALKLVVDLLNAQFEAEPVLTQGYDLSSLTNTDEIPTPVEGNYLAENVVADFVSLGYLDLDEFTDGDRVFVQYDINYQGWSIYTLTGGEWVIADEDTDTQQINTALYWSTVDWFAPGFAGITRFTYNIDSEYDIARLSLRAGDTIRIRNAGNGNFKIYSVGDDLSLQTVGLQNATIRISDRLWQEQPPIETRNLMNAGIAIFTDTITYNNIFFALIRYALSEQKYVDWIFKTSFITVLQRIRRLEQYATYQRDNQSFVQDFINEVKPYRTKVREYLLGYESLDEWMSDVTDFDLPGYYDVDYERFRSPSGELPQDPELWLRPENINWFNNYTYEITDILVEDAGTGYNVPPRVIITGGGGSGASAFCIVSNGFVRRVIVTNPGSGYTSTPTVTLFGGNGTGARLSVRLGNTLTRKIKTTIALDRTSYEPTPLDGAVAWAPSTSYAAGQLVTYNNGYYYAGRDLITGANFVPEDFIELIPNAIDRVDEFYDPRPGMPPRDLAQVFSGIDYPGVFVQGKRFVNPVLEQEDTIIRSFFNDVALGTRPEDILVDGGNYVDLYNSHSPEELIPGITFDALDLKVFTIAPATDAGLGAGPIIRVTSFLGDGAETEYVVATGVAHADSIFAYSKTRGQLYENTDFFYNRDDRTVIFDTAPDVGEPIFIYLFGDAGQGKILDTILPTDGATSIFELPTLDYNLVTDLYVTIDGVKTLDYEFRLGSATGSAIEFFTAPGADEHVHVYAYRGTIGRKNFTEVYTQFNTVTTNVYPDDYSIALDQPVLYNGPLTSSVIVEVNDRRLRPANNAYYVGDDLIDYFQVPVTVGVDPDLVSDNDIEVHINGVKLIPGIDYTVPPSNGVDPRMVNLNTPPAEGDEVVVSLFIGAEFRISTPDVIDISESVNLQPGDVIKIISFSNHDALKMRTQVFVGATADLILAQPGWDGVGFDDLGFDSDIQTPIETKVFTFSTATVVQNSAPPNSNYIWVTLNGERLFPNFDFVMLDHGVLQIGDHISIDTLDEIIITSFTENTQVEPMGFRIFKNARDEVNYYRISNSNTSSLAAPLHILDTEISVVDASVLPEPSPGLAAPGIVFINGERIAYFEIDYVNNLLKRLRRGTDGTGAPDVHPVGSLVVDGGEDQLIPGTAHYVVSEKHSHQLVSSLRNGSLLFTEDTSAASKDDVVVRKTNVNTGETVEVDLTPLSCTFGPLIVDVDENEMTEKVNEQTNALETVPLYEYSIYVKTGTVIRDGLTYETSFLTSNLESHVEYAARTDLEPGDDIKVRVGGRLLYHTDLFSEYSVEVVARPTVEEPDKTVVIVTLFDAPPTALSEVEIFAERASIWTDLDAGPNATTGVGLSFSSTVQAQFLKSRPSYLPG